MDRRLTTLVALPAVVAMLLALLALPILAQSEIQWNNPERIWGYEDEADPPFMAVDQNRTVHTMNSRTVSRGSMDITYRQWTPQRGWTEPVDVVLSPKKDIARVHGTMLDAEGYLHLVFYGGDEQDASVYYTYAPVAGADQARAWAPPVEIGPYAGPIFHGAIVGDGDKKLFSVYSGSAEGMGAYSTHTLDGGLTWSDPVLIHRSAIGQWPTHYGLMLDADGRLHAVWSEADQTGNGQAIYYSKLDEAQFAWTTPVVIERAADFEVDMPALIEYEGEILMVYNSGLPTTRVLRTSSDHGQTWSSAERLFDQIGSDGPVAFVEDSSGTLHMFFGNRVGSPAIHGMWHTVYTGSDFTDPLAIVSGPAVNDPVGDRSFDPQFAKAVVVQGNQVLLTWRQDPGLKGNGVWHAIARLRTPELPVIQPPAAVNPPELIATGEPTPEPASPTSIPVAINPLPSDSAGNSAVLSQSLLLAVLSATALLGSVLIIQLRRRGG